MRRRCLIFVGFGLLALLGPPAWYWWPRGTDADAPSGRRPAPARVGAPGGPARFAAPTAGSGERNADFNAAQARAYAWLGLRRDGGEPPAIDAAAVDEMPFMEAFLAEQTERPGRGLPTVTPRGVHRILGAGDRAADDGEEGRLRELSRRLARGGTELPAGIDEGRRCELVPQPGAVELVDAGRQVVKGPGVWAAIRRAAGSPPLTIAAPAEHPYAVCLIGEVSAFGEIRLDDGLVVPGRFYAVDGAVTVSGAGACSILIRPLSAVPAYHAEPLRPPTAIN